MEHTRDMWECTQCNPKDVIFLKNPMLCTDPIFLLSRDLVYRCTANRICTGL